MIWKKRFVDYLTETCVFFQEDHSYWSVWVTYIPIQYNRVLWPGVQASSFSGPTCHSHYHQISTRFYAVSHIQVLIDWHAQRVVLLSIGCGKWRTLVKVNFKGKVSIPSWKTEKDKVFQHINVLKFETNLPSTLVMKGWRLPQEESTSAKDTCRWFPVIRTRAGKVYLPSVPKCRCWGLKPRLTHFLLE